MPIQKPHRSVRLRGPGPRFRALPDSLQLLLACLDSRCRIAAARWHSAVHHSALSTITDMCFRVRATQPNIALVRFCPSSSHPSDSGTRARGFGRCRLTIPISCAAAEWPRGNRVEQVGRGRAVRLKMRPPRPLGETCGHAPANRRSVAQR